jgi:RNA polymerase sigma-70 factor (ECF subfamily)
MEPGDETILARIRAGDRNQYSLLVERYQGKGMSLAIGILKNSSDAEEALQDAFVRAWRGLDKFEGISGFGTWFYRILYNV